MRKIWLAFAALSLATLAGAQIRYSWVPVPMDSTWDEIKDPSATRIIEKYKPLVGSLDEIVGYSVAEYSSRSPESELSDLAVDIIRYTAEKASGKAVDIALTNFGGIRNSLPKGAVRVYDIISIFPFDNSVVTFDIKGSDLRKFLEQMIARRRVQVLANVEIVIKGNKAEKLNVAGAPIDDARIYRFATINFLMDGGDGIVLRDVASNYEDSGIWIRDAIIDYFREEFQSGKPIDLKTDGRVRIIDGEDRK